ncbi:hypothetical protein EUGRSUZ_F02027 [Eucalyptus grandis]|uniref:Uncharacterized protein n=2 Tax=Eucalyptus grandis TaxID=71139 RepID=A0ACC3KFH7_EUCGR|nr:hypothetical protein EUGRSUZ_F02027 [Eucalyptus grandis]
MAGGEVLKPPKIEEKQPERKISVPRITVEEMRKHSPLMLSPRGQGDGSGKPLSSRMNCLCSPTTHAGSFRCRFHRNTGIPRGHSIGSNLNYLAAKSGSISDSLQAQ